LVSDKSNVQLIEDLSQPSEKVGKSEFSLFLQNVFKSGENLNYRNKNY
jgi:hypothetical protein